MGLLERGHLVEVDRAGLVGQYVGHDGDQDRPRDQARARRRALHRRGLRARARREERLDFGARGDRDAAQADGGLPPPPRRDRRRLPAADAPLPRVEPGPAVALLARDRRSRTTRPTSWSRSRRSSRPRTSTASTRAPTEALRRILDGAQRGEGFGNARFARTLFEQALNAQALRLAGVTGRALAELDARS